MSVGFVGTLIKTDSSASVIMPDMLFSSRHRRWWPGARGDLRAYCESAHHWSCSECDDSARGSHSEAAGEVPSHCCCAACELGGAQSCSGSFVKTESKGEAP